MSANALKVRNSLLLTPLSSAPTSPSNGEMYYDSVANKFKFYENGSFTSLGSSAITSLTGDIVASGPGAASSTIQAGVVSASKLGTVTDGVTLDQSGAGSTLEIKAGGVTNTQVSASAAIAYSKLNLSASIVNADINASAAIAYSKLSLTSSIVNADINASAAIAYSKLNLSASIVNTDVSASAAIAYSKLNLSGSIVNADINTSAAIAYSKLNLSASIVNADVSASAAIAYSKLSLSNSIVNADINASAAISYSKLNLSASIVNADVSASAAIAYSKLALTGSIIGADLTNNTITNAKLAQMAGHTYKGNNTGTTANAADITSTQLTADLNQFTSSLQGLVPGSGGGTANFLRADGSWAAPSGGSGTVSSVDMTVPSFLSVSGNPITTTGTLAVTYSGTALPIANGGTSATSQQAAINALTGTQSSGKYLRSDGTNATLSSIASADLPTITLTSDVTGAASGGSISTTIATNVVTNAKLAQITTSTFKGRTTAGTGNVEDLTSTQATALLNNFVGDSGSGGTKGLVPAPASGDATASKFLKADGTWTAVSGSASGIGGAGFVNIATTYNATSTDNNKVGLLDTSTSYTYTLPPHVSGQLITLKDKTGNASTNNITIARNGGTGKIEGVSGSYLMQADFSAMTFFDDGTDWYRIL